MQRTRPTLSFWRYANVKSGLLIKKMGNRFLPTLQGGKNVLTHKKNSTSLKNYHRLKLQIV
jgi:Cu/Ag efflux pump CusA